MAFAILAAAQARAAGRADDLRAFFKSFEGGWSYVVVDPATKKTIDEESFEVAAKDADSWMVAGGGCSTPVSGSGMCGDYQGVYRIVGVELRGSRGELLTVTTLTSTVLVFEDHTGSGTVFKIRWELLPNGRFSRSTTLERNGVAVGPTETRTFHR